MRATVVIPTYNHGAYVEAAIDSALAQTHHCEIIVVDDGSTDDTYERLQKYGEYVTVLSCEANRGVAAARNLGLADASGEYVMFLDADDTIDDTKLERQLAALAAVPEAGWAWCDTSIRTPTSSVLASRRYAYEQVEGYLFWRMQEANFIPIHAPLFRRSMLLNEAGGFNVDALVEDWDLLTRVSAVSHAVYVPEPLANYIKRPGGRNLRIIDRSDGRVLKLNLGCGNPRNSSWHPLPGFVNLDRRTVGWTFESGFPGFGDGSVDAVTVSHSLMFVHEKDWLRVLREIFRVLRPGGVVRITEDNTADRESKRFGGWRGTESFVTLTSAAMALDYLGRAGFRADVAASDYSCWDDMSLIQRFHGEPPDVFHVEGIKP